MLFTVVCSLLYLQFKETESAAGNELQIVSSELGMLQTECKNTKYLISNASGTMVDAWKICCGFSMIPAVIESRTEMKCIQDRFRNHADKVKKKCVSRIDIY
ncbi:hypothetical protein B566_EDAN016726 [Ephemera danica]|nr:hypothetical protein B566_EDAN016726 [Ephemera danica]